MRPGSGHFTSARAGRARYALAVARDEFDRRLEDIEARVVELFALVADDLPRAGDALLAGAPDAVRVVADRELAVDSLCGQVVDLVARAILLQAPVASDLRFLLAVLRAAPEIERSHDLIVQIASRAGAGPGLELSPRARGLSGQISDQASDMWGRAAQAWYERDGAAGPVLAGCAEELGRLHASLIAELASGPMALPTIMEMTVVAHCYLRLGAHAVNITRRVAYLAGSAA
jgi:phosphate transport system protein